MYKINIRKATEEDIHNIAEMYIKSWKKVFSKFLLSSTINSLNISEKEKIFNDILINQEGVIYIAEDKKNKQIAGYIILKSMSKGTGEIISFYMDTNYITQNIAQELLKYLKGYCIKANINKVVLWTFKGNKSGIKFYKSIGFYETGFEKQSSIEQGQIEIQFLKKISY